jgi:hypothetical protein
VEIATKFNCRSVIEICNLVEPFRNNFISNFDSLTIVTTANFSPPGCGGYTRSGQQFQVSSPIRRVDFDTIQVESSNKDFVATEEPIADFVLSGWDMEEIYRAIRGPRRFSGKICTIELEDFMQEFKCWCDQQILNNPKGFSVFIA